MDRKIVSAALALVLMAPVVATRVSSAQDSDASRPGPDQTDESFKGITFTTSDEKGAKLTLTLDPSGVLVLESPGKPDVKGKATAQELEALKHWNLAKDDLERSKKEGFSRFQVMSKRAYSIRVVKKSPAIFNTYRFDGDGQPARFPGQVRLADALNGLVDRISNGSVYASTSQTIEGTLGYSNLGPAMPRYTVTDDKGHVFFLGNDGENPYTKTLIGLVEAHPWDKDNAHGALDAAQAALGKRIVVQGQVGSVGVNKDDGSEPTQKVEVVTLTRPIGAAAPAPAKTNVPETGGLIKELERARTR